MAKLLRIPRVVIGALTLGAAAPVVALEWRDLAEERDSLAAELERTRSQLARHDSPDHASSGDDGSGNLGARPVVSYAGQQMSGTGAELARAHEEWTQLMTETAALRRELAAASSTPATWTRPEGQLDLDVDSDRSAGAVADGHLFQLMAEGEQLRGRLRRADRDLDEVQLERDEALEQLRREMFTNLLYTAIIGECGRRNSQRGFDTCADGVRSSLHPHWRRFESCVRDYNAIPSYATASSAQNFNNVVRLDRGAVLMCDPGLPEGGSGR